MSTQIRFSNLYVFWNKLHQDNLWLGKAQNNVLSKARIFLLVDLREFFFKFRVRGTKKKALKMTS